MKRLFKNEDTAWKDEANDLAHEVNQALMPVVQAWMRKGYSVREITYVIVSEATHIASHMALTKVFDLRKKRREEQK